jgi:hypothetical protein
MRWLMSHLPSLPVLLLQTYMGGGETFLASYGYYMSDSGGLVWERPQCSDAATCQLDCEATGNVCTLEEADSVGNCTDANPNWQLCYVLPDLPGFTGGAPRVLCWQCHL